MTCFSNSGWIRRALPFAATFLVAVFITSFFVDLNRPRFGGFRAKRHHEMKRLRMENRELRNENFRLQEQLESLQLGHGHKHPGDEIRLQELKDLPVLPPVPVVPHAKR